MLRVEKFTFNPFQENTYVLYDDTKACIIVDPGCYTAREQDELLNYIRSNDLKPVRLVNTHCHVDHIFGNAMIAQEFDLKLEANLLEKANIEWSEERTGSFGLRPPGSPMPEVNLQEGHKLTFGDTALDIYFTPGHAAGHVVFHSPEADLLIAGDVLFKGSIGRVDLPGGDYETLMQSIVNKVLPLGDSCAVMPGHGPDTTTGDERRTNPFILQYMAENQPSSRA